LEIKLIDRLDNLRFLELVSESKRKTYLKETEEYYLPLAKNADEELYNEMYNRVQELRRP